MQLTSHSFTTLEPDQSEERRVHLRQPQSHSVEITSDRDHLDIPVFSPNKPGATSLAPIIRTPLRINQSDEVTQTDISMVDKLEPQTHTTSLYIDRLAPMIGVPLQKDTEVMVILDRSQIGSQNRSDSKIIPSGTVSPQTDRRDGKRFLSKVEVESSVASDGHLTLTPVTERSMELTQGQPRSPEVVGRSYGQRLQMSDHCHFDAVDHHSMFISVSDSMVFF